MSSEDVSEFWYEENEGLTYEENEKRITGNNDELTEGSGDSRNQKETASDTGREVESLPNNLT